MAVKDVIDSILPPENNPIKRWRLTVSCFLILMVGHIAWACGWFGYIGLGNGFALAATQAQLTSDISDIKISLLQSQLSVAQKEYCSAQLSHDIRGETYWGSTIAQLQDEYQTLTGRLYPLPPCPRNGT